MLRAPMRWLALLFTVVLIAAACGDDDSGGEIEATEETDAPEEPEPPEESEAGEPEPEEPEPEPVVPTPVEVVATDFAFAMPAEIPAGAVEMTLQNDGAQFHHAQILRLDSGLSAQELVDMEAAGAIASPADVEALGAWLGGPNSALPFGGNAAATTDELEPGSYALICVIPDDVDGLTHLAKGMAVDFEVTESAAPAAAPASDSEIGMLDLAFDVPDGFDGQGSVAFVNDGEQLHETVLVRIADGATKEELDAFFLAPPGTPPPEGPPPVMPATGVDGSAGGIAIVDPGEVGWNDMALDAGTYALYCFVGNSDEAFGPLFLPHAALGMTTTFEIT